MIRYKFIFISEDAGLVNIDNLQKLRKSQIPKPESHIAYSLEGNVYEKILISNT